MDNKEQKPAPVTALFMCKNSVLSYPTALNIAPGHGFFVSGMGVENSNVDLTQSYTTAQLGGGFGFNLIINAKGYNTLNFGCYTTASLAAIGFNENSSMGVLYKTTITSGTVDISGFDFVSIAGSAAASTAYIISVQ